MRPTERAAWVAAEDDGTGVGHVAVLDVVSESTRAVALYERHGWQVVGRARPPWLPTGRDPLLLMALAAPSGMAVTPGRSARDGRYCRRVSGRGRWWTWHRA